MALHFKDIFCRVSKRFHFILFLSMSHTIMLSSKGKFIGTSDIGTVKKKEWMSITRIFLIRNPVYKKLEAGAS